MIQFYNKAKFDKDITLVLVPKGQTHALLKQTLDQGDLFPVVQGKSLILFLGLGDIEKSSLTDLRVQVRKALISSYVAKAKSVEIVPSSSNEAHVNAIIEAVLIGSYVWDKYKSKDPKSSQTNPKQYFIAADDKPSFRETIKICDGVTLTRDLVNDNADTITSVYLERRVRELVKGQKNISLEVLNKKELTAKGLFLHLAVNQGSAKEPKLIIVKYRGAKPSEPWTAVIGKGITFDTGGLNLKPSNSIETMKIDMAGAGAVCGILKNTIALKIKKNLLFVLGIAENAIGSQAYKPGDVITGYAGKSVEIGNTDAEGRLVLADAFAYVVKNYKPSTMIDLATLTGACVVALGFDYTGLFSNNDDLANDLLASAKATDDRAWRLPIYEEIKEYIKSPIADLKNTSNIKGGGASTAAEFLHQFTNGTPWAHLDIAGTSYAEGNGRFYFSFGATGSGVRLITKYLMNK